MGHDEKNPLEETKQKKSAGGGQCLCYLGSVAYIKKKKKKKSKIGFYFFFKQEKIPVLDNSNGWLLR